MKDDEFDPLIFSLAVCQVLAAVNALVIIWFKGTTIPASIFSRVSPMFLAFAVLGLLTSLRELWIGALSSNLRLALKAVGLLLAAILLFDLWLSQGIFMPRDIVLLVVVGLTALPITWTQLSALHQRRRG